MTAPMQWQQLQFVHKLPLGQSRHCGVHSVVVQWDAFGILYFQFLPLSLIRCTSRFIKRRADATSKKYQLPPFHFYTLNPCPLPLPDDSKFAARQQNEKKRAKSRN